MERVIKFVKAMTKTMTFDENMAKENWPKISRDELTNWLKGKA